jgi:hypothetical protein
VRFAGFADGGSAPFPYMTESVPIAVGANDWIAGHFEYRTT